MDSREKVRQFLIHKRKALGLTQEQFSILALGQKNVSRISDIETGRKKLGLEALDVILTNLNCELEIKEY